MTYDELMSGILFDAFEVLGNGDIAYDLNKELLNEEQIIKELNIDISFRDYMLRLTTTQYYTIGICNDGTHIIISPVRADVKDNTLVYLHNFYINSKEYTDVDIDFIENIVNEHGGANIHTFERSKITPKI